MYRLTQRDRPSTPGLLISGYGIRIPALNQTNLFQVWSSLLPENTVSQGKSSGTVMYDPKNSSTVKKLSGSTWKIRYGDGSSASGVVVTDNVKVGDVIVEDQAIEVATKLSTQLTRQTDSHGILGLGFGVINTVQPEPVNTPLENMILQKDIDEDQELFTCYLGSYKDKNDPDQGESFYTFGGIDQQAVRASGQQISYTPIDDSDGFWKFNSSSVVINGQTMTNPSNMAIADTGTTLMLVSDLVAKAIYEAIPGSTYSEEAQGWLYPANTPADHLPTLSFAIGDTQIVIEKEHIGFALIEGTEMVYGGIQSVGNLPYNIYGDVFLKCVYAVSHSLSTLSFTNVCRCSMLAGSGSELSNVLILPRTLL